MLDALGASRDTIITHSYTPIERGSITERVKRRVAQMRASEDIAATIEAQLFEAADKSESGELGFGIHQMTITVFAGDQAASIPRSPASAASRIRTACGWSARSQRSRPPSSPCTPATWTTGRGT
jgi:type IV secretory pathway VirB4 component